MLAVTRRLLPADDYVRSGNWSAAKPSALMSPQPGNPGRRVGVYGMGEIGRKIAARTAAFETEVGYFSRSQHDVPYRYFPSLEAMAEWCSVLMIAVRAGADTHHAVDAGILQKLGKDGYVVNISRGSVIDQPALVAALTDKTIAGAGLDVFETEPHAPDALTAFPNVVLTPHIGGHTIESHIAMQGCVIANLDAFSPAGRSRIRFRALESAILDRNFAEKATRRMLEISAWQAGKDSLKNPLRTCWLLLARSCSHSENPIRQETVPFRTSAWIARKEGKPPF